jgi:hypothetical protein
MKKRGTWHAGRKCINCDERASKGNTEVSPKAPLLPAAHGSTRSTLQQRVQQQKAAEAHATNDHYSV